MANQLLLAQASQQLDAGGVGMLLYSALGLVVALSIGFAVALSGEKEVLKPDRAKKPFKIFISYRRDDVQHFAGRLRDNLVSHFGSENVFMDVVSIKPGRDFLADIDEYLRQSHVVIVIIGSKWVKDPEVKRERSRLKNVENYVRMEIELAIEMNLQLLPVLVEDVRMPGKLSLPKSLQPLLRRTAVRIHHDTFEANVAPLVSTLKGMQEALIDESRWASFRPKRLGDTSHS